MNMPALHSRRADHAANIRMAIVTGMAAAVNPCSSFDLPPTTTKNWIVKPTKKKKSNFSRAI